MLDGQYETNQNCSYHIQGPTGHAMRIWFRTMDMEDSPNCTRDYVEIRDFESTGTMEAVELPTSWCFTNDAINGYSDAYPVRLSLSL